MTLLKRLSLTSCLILLSVLTFGQIIADHTVVDRYKDIPQEYIDKVKKMYFVYAGESHSKAYRNGLESLELADSKFQVTTQFYGVPVESTSQYLRTSPMIWNGSKWQDTVGEEDWWTNSDGINKIKANISYCNNNGLTISAIGFGWCWDAQWGSGSSKTDPVTGHKWYGESIGGANSGAWGLVDADNLITGNTLNMDSYLRATQGYIDYCKANNIPTKVIFTTGTVDNNEGGFSDEAMYQGHLKWEHIREYVKKDASRILFDYADILCHDDDGTSTKSSWNGNSFPVITPTNLGDASIGHIGEAGALRLAKATWWMLARIAGWEEISTDVKEQDSTKPSSIIRTVNGEIEIEVNDAFEFNKVSLFDLQGRRVAEKKLIGNVCKFNTSYLSSGVYVVSLSGGEVVETQKIVIGN